MNDFEYQTKQEKLKLLRVQGLYFTEEYESLLNELNAEFKNRQTKQQQKKEEEKEKRLADKINTLKDAAAGTSWTVLNREKKTKIKKLQNGLFNVYAGTQKILENVQAATVCKELF